MKLVDGAAVGLDLHLLPEFLLEIEVAHYELALNGLFGDVRFVFRLLLVVVLEERKDILDIDRLLELRLAHVNAVDLDGGAAVQLIRVGVLVVNFVRECLNVAKLLVALRANLSLLGVRR